MSNEAPAATALAKREPHQAELVEAGAAYEGLRMVTSPAEALRRYQELQAFMREVMIEGLDYGKIPGVDKPSLFQPGAQKLTEIYGLAWTFTWDERVLDWAAPFFYFEARCRLTRQGRNVGEGVGSCNSREDRYGWRWVLEAEVPKLADKKLLEQKHDIKWFFQSKIPDGVDKSACRTRTIDTKNGRAQQFAVECDLYRIVNPDIFSLVNTMQKMACKRAFVAAVTAATRSSGIFTQDVEDLPADAVGEVETKRSWDQGKGPDADEVGALVAKLTTALADAADEKALGVVGKAIRDAKDKIGAEAQETLRALYGDRQKKMKKKAAAPTPTAPTQGTLPEQPAPTPAAAPPAAAAPPPAPASAEHDAEPPPDASSGGDDDDGYREDMR